MKSLKNLSEALYKTFLTEVELSVYKAVDEKTHAKTKTKELIGELNMIRSALDNNIRALKESIADFDKGNK